MARPVRPSEHRKIISMVGAWESVSYVPVHVIFSLDTSKVPTGKAAVAVPRSVPSRSLMTVTGATVAHAESRRSGANFQVFMELSRVFGGSRLPFVRKLTRQTWRRRAPAIFSHGPPSIGQF